MNSRHLSFSKDQNKAGEAIVAPEGQRDVFIGRKNAMKEILGAVDKQGEYKLVVLEGNCRIGKTSLLKHFVRNCLPGDRVAVFMNLLDFDGEIGSSPRPGIPTHKLFEGMIRVIVDSVVEAYPELSLPILGKAPGSDLFSRKAYSEKAVTLINPKTPFASFCQITEIIQKQISPKSLLLIFDEFDRLQEGIESGVTSDQAVANLRNVFERWNDVTGIFSCFRSLRRHRQDSINVLFGLGITVRLSGLDICEARALIENSGYGWLKFAPKATDEICRLTCRQPRLIQGVCDRISSDCKVSNRRVVNQHMVDNAASKLVEDFDHFEIIWSYVGSDRGRLLTLLIDQHDTSTGGTTFEQLRDTLELCGIVMTSSELHRELEFLEDLEVITRHLASGIAIYRIEIPLFSVWLRRNKNLVDYSKKKVL